MMLGYICSSVLASMALGQLSISFDEATPLNTVDSTYVAYNIDTGSLYNGMNFSDTKFRQLVTNLGPSIIRIGGTAVDSSYYFPNTPYLIGEPNECPTCGSGAAAIGNEILRAVFDFIIATNMSLLWDLDGWRPRNGTGPWQPAANATPEFAFLESQYGGKIDFSYSVGNEPEFWTPRVSNTQLAEDAVTLKKTLEQFNIGCDVYGSSFAEISTTTASQYLPIAAAGGITGYTVHAYPYGGHNCNISAYLNKAPVASSLYHALSETMAVAAGIPGTDKMLFVLEETAGSSGGGCENVTDRFVAGFPWITTMSTVAKAGFSRVHRQDIAGWSFAFGESHYMLAGPAGWVNGSADLLTPHPDYYTTILFRQLMGRQILNTTVSGSGSLGLKFDANVWCSSAATAPYGAGKVILQWANFGLTDIALTIPTSLSQAASTRYTLQNTPTGSTLEALQSDIIYLNGSPLTINGDGTLPQYPIPGAAVSAGSPVVAPALSYGFIAFNAGAAACA